MTDQPDKNATVHVASPPTTNAAEASSSGVGEGDFVTRNEEQDLVRGLHQRHISLIAIAGAIVRALHPSKATLILTRSR